MAGRARWSGAQTVPDRSAFLHGLRADRQPGPIVAQTLIDDGDIAMDDLGPQEGLRAMTEHLLHLLGIGGPDAVTESLAQLPAGEARDMVTAMVASDHPARVGLDELRTLAEAHFAERRPGRATVHPWPGCPDPADPTARTASAAADHTETPLFSAHKLSCHHNHVSRARGQRVQVCGRVEECHAIIRPA